MLNRLTMAAAVLCAGAAASGEIRTETVNFFPELPRTDHISQLRFVGPQRGEIVRTRLFVDFTPSDGFNASDLTLALVAPVPDSPGFGGWFISGVDLGWTGTTGTFTAAIGTDDLDGRIVGGLWGFELGSLLDPPAYSGAFSATTRFEVDIDACDGDFSENGAVEVEDIFDFLSAWFEGSGRADYDDELGVQVGDIFVFLAAWFEGCEP